MTDKKRIADAVKKSKTAEEADKTQTENDLTESELLEKQLAEKEKAEKAQTEFSEKEKPKTVPGEINGEHETAKLVDALLSAQARIETLMTAVNTLSAENGALKAEVEKLNMPIDYTAVMENDDGAMQAAIASPRVKNAVVTAYLRSLGRAEQDRVRLLTDEGGYIPLAPVAKPKSLAEAKKLAEILIKG